MQSTPRQANPSDLVIFPPRRPSVARSHRPPPPSTSPVPAIALGLAASILVVLAFAVAANPAAAKGVCTFGGHTVAAGETVAAYGRATVGADESCSTQARTCHDGVITGGRAFTGCGRVSAPRRALPPRLVVAPNPCIANGESCETRVDWQPNAAGDAVHQIWMRRSGESRERLLVCAHGPLVSAPVAVPRGQAAEFRVHPAADCRPESADRATLVAAVSVAAIDRAPAYPPPGVGLNALTVLNLWVGRAMGGDGSPAAMEQGERVARKAILDAADRGIPFLRIATGGWFFAGGRESFETANALAQWRRDPEAYWRRVDTLMDALDRAGVGMVPVFFWEPSIFTALAHETTERTLRDPDSRSYVMLADYVTQFVERYRGRPTLLFYELTIELDGAANLDRVARCRQKFAAAAEANCGPVGNYTTNDVIAFTTRLAALIRTLDPTRPISSGFALTHRFDASLERGPEWRGRPAWTADTKEDVVGYAIDIHTGLDLISHHPFNGNRNNQRLGYSGNDDAGFLAVIKEAADRAGKKIYLGAFADQDPPATVDPRARFAENVLGQIVRLGIPYASAFAWELYFNPGKPWPESLDPGVTDQAIEHIVAANRALGRDVAPPPEPDRTPPRPLITSPTVGQAVGGGRLTVTATASDDVAIDRVELSIDDAPGPQPHRVGPFLVWDLAAATLAQGHHLITVGAIDRAQNRAAASISVDNGRVTRYIEPEARREPTGSPAGPPPQ